VIPDSKGPFRLFVDKSILEDTRDERKKSGRISNQPRKGIYRCTLLQKIFTIN